MPSGNEVEVESNEGNRISFGDAEYLYGTTRFNLETTVNHNHHQSIIMRKKAKLTNVLRNNLTAARAFAVAFAAMLHDPESAVVFSFFLPYFFRWHLCL